VTDLRAARPVAQPTAGTPPAAGRGFRPTPRGRSRLALGALLGAIAIGGNALVYSSLDDAAPVVQVVRDVPAGAVITAEMLRTVDVDADGTVNLVPGDRLDAVVGSYAKVRLVSGSLLTMEALQPTALVAAGSAVVAIQVSDGSLPIGLRERVAIVLVVPRADATPLEVAGRVVGLPVRTESALGLQSLSVEVAARDAATIAAADDVRVVLIEPGDDPAPVNPLPNQDGEP
jgi:hypothetical protein